MSTVEQFAALFEGRTDAYGSETGGAVRVMHDLGLPWREHLMGETDPIGVYPLVPFRVDHSGGAWRVKWGCVDLDVKRDGKTRYDYETEDDAHNAAVNLRRVLEKLNIEAWIEVTRSGGRHVWIFADAWMPAAEMRRALLFACSVVDVPPSEVNPKSEGFDDPDTLGNYVRLPYPNGIEGGRMDRRVMIRDDWFPYTLEEFLDEVSATACAAITRAASYYSEPAKPAVNINRGPIPVGSGMPYARNLDGRVYVVWRDGPLDGSDRSGTLFKLASMCREQGLLAAEAHEVVATADVRWGKFHTRRDGQHRLIELVQKAYQ